MSYLNLSKMAQEEILYICKNDQHKLSPETLYRNIKNSNGELKQLVEIFDISLETVKEIKNKEGKQ